MNSFAQGQTSAATRRRFSASLATWLCGWLLATGFVTWHAASVGRYLDRVTATRFATDEVETPMRRVPQAIAPDGQTWIRHSLALAEGGRWRLRSTDTDNAPEGRAIYWNSGWALWLEACGRVRMAVTGEPLARAIEGASLWANLPPFLIVMTLASAWIWRRLGGAAGALAAVALAGHRGFYEGFYPAYCDHHGLINAAVLGVVLGALMAGGGWRRKDASEAFPLLPSSEAAVLRAATISAVCGALGLWVSAASLVVTIALTGAGVLAVAMCGARLQADGLVGVPAAWRRWGRVGAAVSVVFYLLENAPDRLGLRLEANHPLYSLAWWGAGEAIAAVMVWRMERKSVRWLVARLAGWGTLVVAAPVVVGVRGTAVFAPLDPFLGRIHHSIHEFEPLWTAVARAGWRPYADELFIVAGVAPLAVVWWMRKPGADQRVAGVMAGVVVLGSTALACVQNRWLLTASAPQIVLAVVLLTGLAMRWSERARITVFAIAGVLWFGPGPWTLACERLKVERLHDVQMGETEQLLYRDIAGALRKAGASRDSIVLTDPNASVGTGYYGQFRTVGTLYWENRDGLLAAAEMLDSGDEAEVAARIHLRGVTHVALVSSHDFLPEYHYALTGSREPAGGREGFGRRLLYGHRVPVWLRPIDYHVPAPLAPLGFKVALFAVDFSTPAAVAHERIGLYQLAKGDAALAETSFMASLTEDASRPAPWLLEGRLMLESGRVAEAAGFFQAGISRAPERDREPLIRALVALLERSGPEGQARARALSERVGGTAGKP